MAKLSKAQKKLLARLSREDRGLWLRGEDAMNAEGMMFSNGAYPPVNIYSMPGGGIMCAITLAGRAALAEENEK